jgi:hypothetical protein
MDTHLIAEQAELADTAPARTTEVGTPLGTVMADLARLAGQLRPLVAPADADKLGQVQAELGQIRCRVAVLGQVKAGKSSLVNLLIRRPGLSPIDINPWTAVVSSLHFGVPAAPGARAVFTFFDEADWSYLASGGRLRELCDRIGVAIDQNLLKEQLAQTRQRAERRLGRQFYHLLGKQHRFASPTAEILARYVSVGQMEPEIEERNPRLPSAGRFSDITKAADLFFEQAPFNVPITIIDTPGTNDPFLVRDDLTGRALDGADVHIVVLTAEQAFSTADLALLRLLHGLHKQRLVVFVNRIDSLPDIAGDTRRVVEHVRDRLAAEFPNADIPVVAGSARWAELAATGEGPQDLADLPPALLGYARAAGLLPAGGGAPGWRELVAAAAGLGALEQVIARLLRQGPAMLALRRAQGTLASLLGSVESRLQNEQATLGTTLGLAEQDAASDEQKALGLALQQRQIEQIEAELEEVTDGFDKELALLTKVTVVRLKFALDTVVQQFADAQGEALRAAAETQRFARVWHCDTRPLRRELERLFLGIYRHGTKALLETERDTHDRLRGRLDPLLADQRIALGQAPLPVIEPAPPIGPLGQAVALDLNEQWERWWHLWRSTSLRARKLRELMRSEFAPMVAALAEIAARELRAQAAASQERLGAIRRDLLDALAQRRVHLDSIGQTIGDAQAEDGALAALLADYQARRSQHVADLAQCQALRAELDSLTAWCDELASPAPTAPSTRSARAAVG